MKTKKLLSLLLAGTMALSTAAVLSGCNKDNKETNTTTNTVDSADVSETLNNQKNSTASETVVPPTTKEAEPVEILKPEAQEVKKDTEHKIGYQLEKPQAGDEIAIIHTTMGDITLRLFPENAPKTVENFVSLAKEGKYNDVIFHRVISDFMVQTGDFENGDGTGGKSIWGDTFEDEFCDTLYNIRGSVSMANAGINTNGSQFFINQASPSKFDRDFYDYDSAYMNLASLYQQYIGLYGDEVTATFPTLADFIYAYSGGISPLSYAVPEEVWKFYEENGGNIHLDASLREKGGHTVFAQVIEGMDVVDSIAAVEVDESSKPKEDIKIKSIEITTYQ